MFSGEKDEDRFHNTIAVPVICSNKELVPFDGGGAASRSNKKY